MDPRDNVDPPPPHTQKSRSRADSVASAATRKDNKEPQFMSTDVMMRKTTISGPKGPRSLSECGPRGNLPGTRRLKEQKAHPLQKGMRSWIQRARVDRQTLASTSIAAGMGKESEVRQKNESGEVVDYGARLSSGCRDGLEDEIEGGIDPDPN